MDLKLVPNHVRILDRLFAHLSKMSTHVHLYANSNFMTIVGFNSSRSLFTKVKLRPEFFSSYTVHDFQCRILTATLAQIFKLKSSTDKSLDSCSIVSDTKSCDCRLIIKFTSKNSVLTKHKLYFEPLVEVFDIKSPEHSNKWRVSPKLISTWLLHFPPHSEVSIYTLVKSTSSDEQGQDEYGDMSDLELGYIRFRSINITLDNEPMLTTELQLDTDEFDLFESQEDTSFTTSLQDFKVILSLAESIGAPLEARYSTGGIPVEFIISLNDAFIVSTILATTPVFDDDQNEEIPATPPLPCA